MTSTRRLGRVTGTIAFGAALWFGSIPSWAAGLWQWTDGAGRVHKARAIDEVPEEFRASATEIQDGGTIPNPAGPTVPPPRTEPAVPARRASPPGVPSATASPAGSATGEQGTDAGADRDGHDRAWWQSQVVETRRQINDLEAKIEHLKSEGLRTPSIRKEREARKELVKAQDELKKAKGKLQVDLPEAAAKAGAPASWLLVK